MLLLHWLLTLAMAAAPVLGQRPPWPATWQMNSSTAAMVCSYTGYMDPSSLRGWGLLDIDWSNALGNWSAATPMDTNERLLVQAGMIKVADPATRVWTYKNSVYGYPWYTTVRFILDDEAYSPWFIKYSGRPPYTSPPCDDNYTPPKCTDYFHTQMDTPNIPGRKGYGTCAPPACNCGSKPCGFYVFNHSSDAIVHGLSFREWYVYSYMLDAIGASPYVDGFFWDDFFSLSGDMGDNTPNATADMGLTPADLAQLTAAYDANMAALRAATLAAGKFSWQMFWTGGAADAKGDTCPGPLVHQATCAADLRALCAADSPQQVNRTMMYAFSPGYCRSDPSVLPEFEQDLASFLLVRGDYAYLGHGWLDCSRDWAFPAALNADYGVPTSGLCAETARGSGVFTREYSKASVAMDCTTWKGTVTMKEETEGEEEEEEAEAAA